MIQEKLTEYELIVDSYEQARKRPGDNQEQEKYYSGKKCNHTLKCQMVTLPNGSDIVDIVAGELGPKSDITLLRRVSFTLSSKPKI